MQKRIACITALAILGASCSSVTAPSSAQLEADETAFVKGMSSSAFSLGSTFEIKIESVDGKSTRNQWTGYSDGLTVPAGARHLVTMCMMSAEVGNVQTKPSETVIDADFVAGHVYQLQPAGKNLDGGCGTKLMDVTGQKPR